MASETTWIDVVDTAIKIGLGGVISGVVTYLTLNRKQKLEMDKLTLEEKKEMTKECAYKIGKADANLSHIMLSLYKSYENGNENGKEDNKTKYYLDEQSKIIDVENYVTEASIIALLLGYREVEKLIDELGYLINDLGKYFHQNQLNINHDVVINMGKDISKKGTQVLNKIHESYNANKTWKNKFLELFK